MALFHAHCVEYVVEYKRSRKKDLDIWVSVCRTFCVEWIRLNEIALLSRGARRSSRKIGHTLAPSHVHAPHPSPQRREENLGAARVNAVNVVALPTGWPATPPVHADNSEFAICSCVGILQICQWCHVCDAGALRAEPLATLYILRGQKKESPISPFGRNLEHLMTAQDMKGG